MLDKIADKVKEIFKKANEHGIYLPMITDPKSGSGSVSLTMLFASFNLVLAGIIGKSAKVLEIDVNQALNLFYGCSALYFGRKMQKDDKGNVVIESTTETKTTEVVSLPKDEEPKD